jgi:hypothetical protein
MKFEAMLSEYKYEDKMKKTDKVDKRSEDEEH